MFFIFIASCASSSVSYYSFAKDNNIDINYLIDDSEYIDNDLSVCKLTYEQREKLVNFLNIFESTDEYIKNIIHGTAFQYEITKIDVFYNDYNYGFYINFWSTEKLAHHSKYDDNKKYWQTFNIAHFRLENDKIRFIGWHI